MNDTEISAIACALRLHWHTVQKYAACAEPPLRRHTVHQPSMLTPRQDDLIARWMSGCQNARQVWCESAARGYPGAYRTVARVTGYLRKRERSGESEGEAPPRVAAGMTPAQAAGLVVVRLE